MPHTKIFYLPFIPHDIKNFRNPEGQCVRDQLLRADKAKLIIFVGRLSKEKNVIFLLRCFCEIVRKFRKVRLVIIGEGQEERSLKRAARELEIADKIDWIGFVPRPRLTGYFRE